MPVPLTTFVHIKNPSLLYLPANLLFDISRVLRDVRYSHGIELTIRLGCLLTVSCAQLKLEHLANSFVTILLQHLQAMLSLLFASPLPFSRMHLEEGAASSTTRVNNLLLALQSGLTLPNLLV